VEWSREGRIRRIGESSATRDVVTAGLYLVLRELPKPAQETTVAALRDYLEFVVDLQSCVWGKKFNMALDIDCPEDVRLAESLL
jgi:hypothetical protein